MTRPFRLAATPYDKVWGTPRTEPWFQNPEGRMIGEIWFAASPEVPLLAKLLFTSERLSVQVHPDDTYAREHENSRGKTEMWHVLRADPGAQVALGLREPVTRERLRQISETGEIEGLLNWVSAQAGDTFFVPAGTIHAIGAGLVLCEVQQLSDVTYRLYDYGRPRPLHLDHAINVSWFGEGNDARAGLRDLPVECRYFRTARLRVNGVTQCPAAETGTLYIAIEGEGVIAGQAFRQGEAWEASGRTGSFTIESSGATFLTTHAPRLT